MKIFLTSFILITVASFANGCKHKKEQEPFPPPLLKKEKSEGADKVRKGPIINIADTVAMKQIVLTVKDSAATSAGMSLKLNNIYNNLLPAAVATGKLKTTGQPMAWYHTKKAYYSFEAGLPVDKAPTKAVKGINVKRIGGDSALVAHFFGPYELTTAGYEALNEMINDRHRKRSSPAYEVYVKNPFAKTNGKIDPYKWQTDIVMPYK